MEFYNSKLRKRKNFEIISFELFKWEYEQRKDTADGLPTLYLFPSISWERLLSFNKKNIRLMFLNEIAKHKFSLNKVFKNTSYYQCHTNYERKRLKRSTRSNSSSSVNSFIAYINLFNLNMKQTTEILSELHITFQKEMDYVVQVIFPELMKRLWNKLNE